MIPIVFASQSCYKLPAIRQGTTKDLKALEKYALLSKKNNFFWLKPYILFPNLTPALINENSDGDSLDGERAGIPLQQTPILKWH